LDRRLRHRAGGTISLGQRTELGLPELVQVSAKPWKGRALRHFQLLGQKEFSVGRPQVSFVQAFPLRDNGLRSCKTPIPQPLPWQLQRPHRGLAPVPAESEFPWAPWKERHRHESRSRRSRLSLRQPARRSINHPPLIFIVGFIFKLYDFDAFFRVEAAAIDVF